jgi:thiol-disulfide isomerase/thioredoxin
LRSFAGPLISLSDYRGEVVVLNFWASWCVPCREEMPNLERAWREFRPQRVTVLGLNVADDYDDAAAFLRTLGITYPNVFDPEQSRLTAYQVSGLPTTVFIDRQMRIRAKVAGGYLGADGYATLRRQVLALIRAASAPP